MMKCGLIAGFCLFPLLAFGQLDSNSVTVTASRSVNLQGDEALLSVSVSSGTSATLTDIVAALQGTGIAASNLSGVNTSQSFNFVVPGDSPVPRLTLDWRFSLTVPLPKLKDMIATLTSLQQSIMKNNSGLSLSFAVQGIQVSSQLQQMQACAISDLLSDARAKAQKLADAAGLSVGTVLAMSSATSTTTGPSSYAAFGVASVYIPGCSLTVKFALGRF
jgi:uncharacterized protein YggE